jgi:magnesium transporter
MLRSFDWQTNRLAVRDATPETPVAAAAPEVAESTTPAPPPPVWLDLLNPTAEETAEAERTIGVQLPTRDEMQEIELSDRLYHEDGAEFMTVTVLTQTESETPKKSAVTFVLKRGSLITLRHVDPKPFRAFFARCQRPGAMSAGNGEHTMLGILEAIIDRLADTLERVGVDIDSISTEIFRNKARSVTSKTRDLQMMIERLGRQNDLLGMARESLVSIARMAAYHGALDVAAKNASSREARQRLKLVQRDVGSLGEHAAFLSSKTSFLLDATLGVINLEQNQIIKIFSVAAVVFLPPTLVASIYGMNFTFMPELQWPFGYPLALGLMVLSAIVPYLFFKRRGWL